MKFNIVLFNIGIQYKFCNLYKRCLESIKKEFPEDNIIIFRSFEEIEKQYYIPDCYWKRNAFQKMFLTDYYRLCLSKYIDNMLYIDSDIFVYEGFRDEIINNIQDKDFVMFGPGHYLFFSKINKNNDDYNKLMDFYATAKEIMLDFEIRKKYCKQNIIMPSKHMHFYCNKDATYNIKYIDCDIDNILDSQKIRCTDYLRTYVSNKNKNENEKQETDIFITKKRKTFYRVREKNKEAIIIPEDFVEDYIKAINFNQAIMGTKLLNLTY